ncbi:MAG: hypothetical protein ACRDQF_03755, partial [Thermocrispum sp.]
PFVEKWRRRVEQHAPESLNAYDDLVHKAFEDGRFQRFGRVAEIESISFKPRVVAAERLEREYDQSTRDIQRLLRRIQKDATELKQVKEVVEQERRRGSALEAKLTALRRSRTYRVGRAIGKLATPVTAVRSAVARVKRTSSSS